MSEVIVITGASSGIGKTTALRLLQEGYIVYGLARRIDCMQDIIKQGGHAFPLDITKPENIRAVIKQIISKEGKIDVLINNAGYAVFGAVEDVTSDEARAQFEVNLFGLARITQEVLPFMRKEKTGKIINISSIAGKMYTPLGAWYHASKHALEGWSDCLRFELKSFGIKVVIVEPGIIQTEFDQVMAKPLLERSKNGAYAYLAKQVANSSEKFYSKERSSPPSVISGVLVRILKSKNPKTRYAAGKWAKLMLFLRKILSDKLFDKILWSQLND